MIYVDKPKHYPNTTLRFKWWSHMWSDTSDVELHEMAQRLGLKREWFQTPTVAVSLTVIRFYNHYDVVPTKRALAIQYGAEQIEPAAFYEKVVGRAL